MDTSREAADVQAAIVRRMSPEERVGRAVELSEALRRDDPREKVTRVAHGARSGWSGNAARTSASP